MSRRATRARTGRIRPASTSSRRAIPTRVARSTRSTATRPSAPTSRRPACRATSSCSTPTSTTRTSRPTGASPSTTRVQINLRRLLSSGLTLDANYTFSTRDDSRLDDLRVARTFVKSDEGVPHALKITANYELPFGRGRRFASSANGWLDAAIGGWSLNLTGRVQSGSILNFGNVRVVGMSIDELRGRVRDPRRPGDQDRLYAAAGHHRQHDQGVQHQRDVGDGLRRARRAGRALPGAGERSGLHPGGSRRLRAERRLRRGAGLHALRPERQEALPLRGDAQRRHRRRRAESLQRHQLHGGRAGRKRRDDQPGQQRVSGSERHVRSGRTADAAGLPGQLLGRQEHHDALIAPFTDPARGRTRARGARNRRRTEPGSRRRGEGPPAAAGLHRVHGHGPAAGAGARSLLQEVRRRARHPRGDLGQGAGRGPADGARHRAVHAGQPPRPAQGADPQEVESRDHGAERSHLRHSRASPLPPAAEDRRRAAHAGAAGELPQARRRRHA